MRGWHLVDLATRVFWRSVGRPVDLTGPDQWLSAPMHSSGPVGQDWVQAEITRLGGEGHVASNDGLLADVALLDSTDFDHRRLHPSVREFYEHTASWRAEVWVSWNAALRPFGAMVARLFGRRVQQLAIPVDPLAVSRGMDSQVIPLLDREGHQHAAAWIRSLRSTGELVYSGHYAVTSMPSTGHPAVHVSFPLEAGNVQVFLRPAIGSGGSLFLRSPREDHGGHGTYVVVRLRGRTYAARPPLTETFHVFVDDEGVLRTDHDLRFFGIRAMRLHYRLQRSA